MSGKKVFVITRIGFEAVRGFRFVEINKETFFKSFNTSDNGPGSHSWDGFLRFPGKVFHVFDVLDGGV